MRPTPPRLPLICHPNHHIGNGDDDDDTVDVPPLLLSQADTASDGTTASIRADDTDAAPTQDSYAADEEDDGGDPINILGDDIGSGNTVADDDGVEPVIVDAVIPTTTNTAAEVTVVGGVQVAALNEDAVEADANAIANVDVEANPTGDGNQTVHNNANADATTDATANGGPPEDLYGTADAAEVADGDTPPPPPAPPTGTDVARTNAEYFTPQHSTDVELHLEDPLMQDTTPADLRLISIYGDTIHQNDGRHLDGGIGAAEDRKWQRLYMRIAACKSPLYDLPNGRWAVRFLAIQTQL